MSAGLVNVRNTQWALCYRTLFIGREGREREFLEHDCPQFIAEDHRKEKWIQPQIRVMKLWHMEGSRVRHSLQGPCPNTGMWKRRRRHSGSGRPGLVWKAEPFSAIPSRGIPQRRHHLPWAFCRKAYPFPGLKYVAVAPVIPSQHPVEGKSIQWLCFTFWELTVFPSLYPLHAPHTRILLDAHSPSAEEDLGEHHEHQLVWDSLIYPLVLGDLTQLLCICFGLCLCTSGKRVRALACLACNPKHFLPRA